MSDIKEVKTKFDLKKKRYFASKDGKVYYKNSSGDYIPLKPFTTRDGYVEYVLTKVDGSKQHIQAQVIILSTFGGTPKKGSKLQANHKDGIRNHNAFSNLEWVTPKQNIKHSFDMLNKRVWNSPTKKK